MEVNPSRHASDRPPGRSASRPAPAAESEARCTVALHELRNPLAAILTASEAILNITDLTPEELHEYLKQIRSSAFKIDEIIDRLLLHVEAR